MSVIEVHHCWVRNRPRRLNRVSSNPTASVAPIRSVSTANSASPQAVTVSLTVCQSQPNSVATSFTVRPLRPTWMVAHRPALVVIT
jgi:hypothetical protein